MTSVAPLPPGTKQGTGSSKADTSRDVSSVEENRSKEEEKLPSYVQSQQHRRVSLTGDIVQTQEMEEHTVNPLPHPRKYTIYNFRPFVDVNSHIIPSSSSASVNLVRRFSRNDTKPTSVKTTEVDFLVLPVNIRHHFLPILLHYGCRGVALYG